MPKITEKFKFYLEEGVITIRSLEGLVPLFKLAKIDDAEVQCKAVWAIAIIASQNGTLISFQAFKTHESYLKYQLITILYLKSPRHTNRCSLTEDLADRVKN